MIKCKLCNFKGGKLTSHYVWRHDIYNPKELGYETADEDTIDKQRNTLLKTYKEHPDIIESIRKSTIAHGCILTEEGRKNKSIKSKQTQNDSHWKKTIGVKKSEKISKALRGRKQTPERRLKKSLQMKKAFKEGRIKVPSNKGNHSSEELKRATSIRMMGNTWNKGRPTSALQKESAKKSIIKARQTMAANGYMSSLEKEVNEFLHNNKIKHKHEAVVGRKLFDFRLGSNVFIEVDGDYWHRDKEKDLQKYPIWFGMVQFEQIQFRRRSQSPFPQV